MPYFSTAGSKIYIGGQIESTSGDLVEASFSGVTWVEITGSQSLGSVGDEAAQIPITTIDDPRTRKLKGSRDGGSMELVFISNLEDAGQQALVLAEKEYSDYAFKIELPDAPSGGTPSMRMFAATVGSAREVYDSADDEMKLQSSLWVNSNIVRVAAAS